MSHDHHIDRRFFRKGKREVEVFERNIKNFWEKVDKSGDCWMWKACKDKAGYGKIQVGRTYFLAHRFSFMLHGGTFPYGKPHVLHSCDTPSCVNPAHLRAGDDFDNMKEMSEKGRAAFGTRSGAYTHPEKWKRGENNCFSKLTDDLVRYIRKRRKEGGVTLRELSEELGVCLATVDHAARGKTWKHII